MIRYVISCFHRILRENPANGEGMPPCHHDTWPETWDHVPSRCPICGAPTLSDRYLDSRAGPGWRCTLESIHFWQVRMESSRRYCAAHPLEPVYPWVGYSPAEQQAWLEAHYHPPRVTPSNSTAETAPHPRAAVPAYQLHAFLLSWPEPTLEQATLNPPIHSLT
jgi:hypothetical protein